MTQRRMLGHVHALPLLLLLALLAHAPRASWSVSTALPVHRRPECALNSLWQTDFLGHTTVNALNLADEPSVVWRAVEACDDRSMGLDEGATTATTDTMAQDCFKREQVAVVDGHVTLTATSDAAAGVRVTKSVDNPWNSTTRLRIRTSFPSQSESESWEARLVVTVLPQDVETTLRVVAPLGIVELLAPALNVSVRKSLPCADHPHQAQALSIHNVNETVTTRNAKAMHPRHHELEVTWSSEWLTWFWNGRVLHEMALPQQRSEARDAAATGTSASVMVDTALTVAHDDGGNRSSTLVLYELALHHEASQDGEGSLEACRPLQSPEANCRATTAFKPRVGRDQGYLSLREVNDFLDSVVARFPAGFARTEEIGVSTENRSIVALCIGSCHDDSSDDGNTTRHQAPPQVLFTGMHHSREPVSMMNLIYTIDLLALDLHNGVMDVVSLLFSRQLWFVVLVNPDGYARNEKLKIWTSGKMGIRKNMRTDPGCKQAPELGGVDLNRNYGVCFDQDLIGSNTNPCEDDYRGPAAFSEPETRAIKDLVEKPGMHFTAALNYHSFGRYFNIPFACEPKGIPEQPDMNVFTALANEMTRFNGFGYGQSWRDDNLYSVNGETSDWMWATHGIWSMSPEVGPAFENDADVGFWPPEADVPALASELYYSNLALAWRVGALYEVTVLHTKRHITKSKTEMLVLKIQVSNQGLGGIPGDSLELIAATTGALTNATKGNEPAHVARESIETKELATMQDGQVVTRRVALSTELISDGVVHVLLRDGIGCNYIRVRVNLDSEQSVELEKSDRVAFQQWQSSVLPRCGVCRMLKEITDDTPSDESSDEDPRCSAVNDLVSLETLILKTAAPGSAHSAMNTENRAKSVAPPTTGPTPLVDGSKVAGSDDRADADSEVDMDALPDSSMGSSSSSATTGSDAADTAAPRSSSKKPRSTSPPTEDSDDGSVTPLPSSTSTTSTTAPPTSAESPSTSYAGTGSEDNSVTSQPSSRPTTAPPTSTESRSASPPTEGSEDDALTPMASSRPTTAPPTSTESPSPPPSGTGSEDDSVPPLPSTTSTTAPPTSTESRSTSPPVADSEDDSGTSPSPSTSTTRSPSPSPSPRMNDSDDAAAISPTPSASSTRSPSTSTPPSSEPEPSVTPTTSLSTPAPSVTSSPSPHATSTAPPPASTDTAMVHADSATDSTSKSSASSASPFPMASTPLVATAVVVVLLIAMGVLIRARRRHRAQTTKKPKRKPYAKVGNEDDPENDALAEAQTPGGSQNRPSEALEQADDSDEEAAEYGHRRRLSPTRTATARGDNDDLV